MIKTLSLSVGDDPPTEFRIFTSGVVDTVKGQFRFDAKSAKLVLAEYKAHGIDMMIDYDHASLSAEHAIDPANSGKAAGWFNLELRNGELWAVNVRWTPPAAEALRRKEWRFMSPAFATDKDGLVTALLNVALTNIPATRRLDPLVAASKGDYQMAGSLDPKLIKQALDAIQNGDDDAATEILKSMIASAAGADPDAPGDADGGQDDGAAQGVPAAEAAVTDPKVVDASDEPPPSSKPGASDDDDDSPPKKQANKAMRQMLCRLTGKQTFAEAVAETETWRTSHLSLESQQRKLAAERATIESAERRQLVTSLITCGAEFPATVWADDKATAIKPRWLKMPISALRTHVAEQRAARGTKAPTAGGAKPPPGSASGETVTLDDGRVVTLSAEEVAVCKSMQCEPKNFAALKAFRDGKGN